MLRIGIVVIAALTLAACNRGGGGDSNPLFNLRAAPIAPDEFLVVPQRPLDMPTDLATLPEPTPGSGNRVDIDFQGNLITALGGRTRAVSGVPAADAALVAAVRTVSGGTDGIRETLRAEDQAFRAARAGRIARLARDNAAITIYDDMLLDPLAEIARLRASGVKVPTVPPN